MGLLTQSDPLYYKTPEGTVEYRELWKVMDDLQNVISNNTSPAASFSNGSFQFSTLSFGNSNGVSFYQSNGSVFGSISSVGAGGVVFSAGLSSSNLTNVVFANSNGVSFGLSGSVITASVVAQTVQPVAASGSNGSFAFSTLSFGNSNGLSLYTTNGSIVGSYTVPAGGASPNFSAGTTSNNLASVVFADLNGVSFGLNGSTITASVLSQSVQPAIGLNTAGTNITWTANSSGISINASAYLTSQSVQPSIGLNTAQTNVTWTVNSSGISLNAGAYLTTAMASDAGSRFVNTSAGLNLTNISATFNSNSISLSVAPQSAVAQNASLYALGNTTQNSSTVLSVNALSFNAIGSLTIGYSNGSIQFSSPNAITTARASNDAVGLNTAQTNVTWTVNSSGISFNAGAYLTSQSNQPVAASAGNGSFLFSTLAFIDRNGVSWASSTDGMRASVRTDYRNNTDAIGLNTAGTNITWTANSSGLSIDNGAYLTTAMASNAGSRFVNTSAGLNLTNVSATFNSNSISLSVAAQSAVAQNVSLYALGNTTQNSSTVLSVNALSYNAIGSLTIGYSNGSIQFSSPNAITTARASTDGIGLNTAKTNVTWTVNSSGLSLDASGYAGTVTAATNATFTLNSNGLSLSVAAPGAGATPAYSGSNGSFTANTVTFGNLNNISFYSSNGSMVASYSHNQAVSASNGSFSWQTLTFGSLNGLTFYTSNSSIVGSYTVPADATLSSMDVYKNQVASTVLTNFGFLSSAQVTVFPFTVEQNVSVGVMNLLCSVNFLTVGTSSGRQSGGINMAIYSRSSDTLNSMVSTSFSWGITGNNSSYSISQITQTAYSGYGAMSQVVSAGSNITSGYTGAKIIGFPINTLLTPGVYWLGMIGTASSSSVNIGLSISYFGMRTVAAAQSAAPLGSFSSNYSVGSDPFGRYVIGGGVWSAVAGTGIPASINITKITTNDIVYPNAKFWRT